MQNAPLKYGLNGAVRQRALAIHANVSVYSCGAPELDVLALE